MSRRRSLVALVVGATLAVGCADDGGGTASTSPATTAAPATSGAATTEPPTIPPTTVTEPTTSPTTLVPATTAAPPTTTGGNPTTTVGPASGTWVPAELPPWAAAPCCGAEWPVTDVSPVLPAPGTPFSDGIYPIEVSRFGWTSFEPDLLTLLVRRFERCGADPGPRMSCQGAGPDEIGVDTGSGVEVTVPLDAAVPVGLIGFACDDSAPAVWQSDGVGLATLWTAVDADFERQVRTPMWAGTPAADVIAGLDPGDGAFRSSPCEERWGPGAFWQSEGGPALFFQTVGRDGEPLESDELLWAVTMEVHGGQITLYVERTWTP